MRFCRLHTVCASLETWIHYILSLFSLRLFYYILSTHCSALHLHMVIVQLETYILSVFSLRLTCHCSARESLTYCKTLSARLFKSILSRICLRLYNKLPTINVLCGKKVITKWDFCIYLELTIFCWVNCLVACALQK